MSSRKGNASTIRCMRVSAISSTFPLGTATHMEVCHASKGGSQLPLSWLLCSRLRPKRLCGLPRGGQEGEPVCEQDVEIECHRQGCHDRAPVVPDQGPLCRNGLQREQQKSRRCPAPRQEQQDAGTE